MSRTSRARKLSALTNFSYQNAVQHLDRLGLGPRDEKEYVNSLAGGGVIHHQTCVCALQFFTLTPNAALCPRCAKAAPSVDIAEAPQMMDAADLPAKHLRETMEVADLTAKHLRETMEAADLTAKHPREMTEAATPARRLQEMRMAEKAHSARSLHEMRSASDPARRLLETEMLEKAHSARSLHDMMSASDPARRLQEMRMAEKAYSPGAFRR